MSSIVQKIKTTRFKFHASEVLLPSSEMLNAKCSKANNIRKKKKQPKSFMIKRTDLENIQIHLSNFCLSEINVKRIDSIFILLYDC